MSVKGHLALLVGVFVVALATVTLVRRGVVGDLGDVVRDVARSQAPKACAARELRASHLAERRALAGFLLTGSSADAAALEQARRDVQRWRAELDPAELDPAERAALAEADRLLADQQAAAGRAVARRRAGGSAAGPTAAALATPPPARPGTGWSSCWGSCPRRPPATSTPVGPGPSGPWPPPGG
jgi:CHASE3 domain sensor protein